ncbi:leucine-rich repeat domain-containing protein [Treponema sp. R80B11-R83G3]
MNKKMWIIAVVLILAVIGTTNAQQYETEKNFKVEKINGGKAIRIVEYKGKNKNVNIPPQINKLPVVEIAVNAFSRKGLTGVTIPDSVTSIGEIAFFSNNLTSITIPDSVTSIGEGAFSSNNLTSITIPDSITSIGEGAFFPNRITQITIGSNVQISLSTFDNRDFYRAYEKYGKRAGTYSFNNRREWVNETVEEQKKAEEAMQAAKKAEEQAIAAAAGYIQLTSMFAGTVLLNGEATQYTVGEGEDVLIMVENAKDKEYTVAVRDSSGTVRQATQKITISEIGVDRNRKPNSIYSVMILDPNPKPNSGDDFDIRQNAQGGITITGYNGTRKQVVIPDTISGIKVTEIGDSAFSHGSVWSNYYDTYVTIGKEILSVVIPNSVTKIGERAFSPNSTLRSVVLPNTITMIPDWAFYGCALDTVTIPNSVTAIGNGAFAKNQLTSITFGNRVAKIGDGAFMYNNLKELKNLPTSLKTIGTAAFAENNITTLTIPNGVTNLGTLCFSNNPIKTLVIPPSLAQSGFSDAFQIVSEWRPANDNPWYTYEYNIFPMNMESGIAITLPANVADNFENFSSTLLDFYKSQGKKAGTYSFDGRLWKVK